MYIYNKSLQDFDKQLNPLNITIAVVNNNFTSTSLKTVTKHLLPTTLEKKKHKK